MSRSKGATGGCFLQSQWLSCWGLQWPPNRAHPGESLEQVQGGEQGQGHVRGAGGWGPHSSAVDWGMRSGILVSLRLEHSATPASQRHLWGQTTSLLHSLFSW